MDNNGVSSMDESNQKHGVTSPNDVEETRAWINYSKY